MCHPFADDALVPDVSMVALSLDMVAVRGKVKDFVKQVLKAREDAAEPSHSKTHSGDVAAGKAMTLESPPRNTATMNDLVKVYSRIRSYEIQLACVLTELSARILPTVSHDQFATKLAPAPTVTLGNTARFPSFVLKSRLAKDDADATTQFALSVDSTGFSINVDPSIVPHIGGLQATWMTAHKLLPPFTGAHNAAPNAPARADVIPKSTSGVDPSRRRQTMVHLQPDLPSRSDEDRSTMSTSHMDGSQFDSDLSQSGGDSFEEGEGEEEEEEQEDVIDLPLVYDISVSFEAGECNFFESVAAPSQPAPAAFPGSSRKAGGGLKGKGPSPLLGPTDARSRLFTIPLPAISVSAHQGAADASGRSTDGEHPAPTPLDPSMMLSPASQAPGGMFSPSRSTRQSQQTSQGPRPMIDVGVSNVVYARVSLRTVDASPLLFVFLQQLVLEWQVCACLSLCFCVCHGLESCCVCAFHVSCLWSVGSAPPSALI